MTADYTDEKETAYDDIKENGAAITISRFTKGEATRDPIRDRATLSTWTGYSTYGLIDDFSIFARDGSLIQQGDQKMLVPALHLSIEPRMGDRIEQGDTRWSIINSQPVAPSNDPIMFILQLRA